MTATPFSLSYINAYIEKILDVGDWSECPTDDAKALSQLHAIDEAGTPAGSVRLWRAPNDLPLDRMIHMRLTAGPVETQLLFVFGLTTSTMPHLHLQIVQFPPEGCVYNVDLLPRVDPVDDPAWFERVFNSLRRPYRKATADANNSCAQAPANPALAVYMSPWGIASGRADKGELDRVRPCIDDYLSHYISLARESDWLAADPAAMADRDRRHLEIFFGDELDPRAWNGVYKVIGEERGKQIKELFKTPLKAPD